MAQKGRRQPGGKHGRFLGPARVLATESRRDDSGNIRPGGSIWIVKGRSLLKCSPEQLRHASEREELLEALASPGEQQAPWTFHTVSERIGGSQFEDESGEIPEISEWRRAQRPEEEIQPARYRVRQKRPAEATAQAEADDMEQEETTLPADTRSHARLRERSRSRGRGGQGASSGPSALQATAWWNDVKGECLARSTEFLLVRHRRRGGD